MSDVTHLIKILRDGRSRARRDAAAALGKLGLEAQEAAPALAHMALDDPNAALRAMGADALQAVDGGAQAVTVLRASLDSADPDVRQRATELLSRYGPRARGCAARIAALALADTDDAVVSAASAALASIDEQGESVAPIALALHADDPVQRARAAHALASLGARSVTAVAELARRLADAEPEVRRAAALAIVQIGPQAAASVASLIAALSDAEVRLFAIMALGRMGPVAAAAVGPLRALRGELSLRGTVDGALAAIVADDQS